MNKRLHKVLLTGLILPVLVLARPGDIDTGAGPLPVLPIVRPDGSLYEIVPVSSTGILASRRVVLWNARATGEALGQFDFTNPFGHQVWRIYDPVLLLANGDLLIPAVGPMGGSVPGALVSHVMRVRPDGQRDPGFGNGGIVSLDDQSPEAPLRTRRMIAGLRELPDGRILLLESLSSCDLLMRDFGTLESRTDGWDSCNQANSSVVRLLGDGRLDTTFGTDGRTMLFGISERVMFKARADGGAAIADVNGLLQVLDGTGEMARSREFDSYTPAALQLPDERLLVIQQGNGRAHLLFTRLLADLQPDSSFGTRGEVDFSLGTLLAPRIGAAAYVRAAELSEDATHLFVAVELTAWDAPPFGVEPQYRCTGVARFRLGPPFELDASFGKGGFTCLTQFYSHPYMGTALLRQPDGGLLYSVLSGSDWPDSTLRLFTDDSTSTGRIEATASYMGADEDSGTVKVTVSRLAGRVGAIHADWSTRDWEDGGNAALAGLDYTASSGRLSWADGDDGEQTIFIPILDDTLPEGGTYSGWTEYFNLNLSIPTPFGPPRMQTVGIGIRDNDPAPVATSGPGAASTLPPPSIPSGGGGSTGPLLLLALAGTLWRRIGWRMTVAA